MTLTRRHALLGLPLLAAACASAEPDYYRLEPVSPARPPASTVPRQVELRRIGLARYLDRPEILRAGEPGRVELVSGARWAEPLDVMIGRVLAENLTRRLPGSTVIREGSAISAESDRLVEVEIQRFEADAAGRIVLAAQVAVQAQPRGRRLARSLRLESPAANGGTTALVVAMSAALGEMADAIAALLAGPAPERTTRR